MQHPARKTTTNMPRRKFHLGPFPICRLQIAVRDRQNRGTLRPWQVCRRGEMPTVEQIFHRRLPCSDGICPWSPETQGWFPIRSCTNMWCEGWSESAVLGRGIIVSDCWQTFQYLCIRILLIYLVLYNLIFVLEIELVRSILPPWALCARVWTIFDEE